MKPSLFISAVSSELKSARQQVANTLTRIGYEPVWQDIFGTSPGKLLQMLRDNIDSCEGVIHLVSFGYGAEPPKPDPNFGRVSYTQFEFLYARQKEKKTWIIFVESNCTLDALPESLDLPRDEDNKDPAEFQAERRALQKAWRDRLRTNGIVRYTVKDDTELKLVVEQIKDERRVLSKRFKRWQGTVLGLCAASILVLIVLLVVQLRLHAHVSIGNTISQQRFAALRQQLESLNKTDIEAQLREAIERAYEEQLAAADQLPHWKKRRDAKKAAAEWREQRLSEVSEFIASITSTIESGEASVEFLEMARIIQEEGVDSAVAFLTSKESHLLDKANRLTEQQRRILSPLLEGVRLQLARGQLEEALTLCAKLLAQDSNWPELLHEHYLTRVALGDRATNFAPIMSALDHFVAAETSARFLYDLDRNNYIWRRDICISLVRIGKSLASVGHSDQAISKFEEALRIHREQESPPAYMADAERNLSIAEDELGRLYLKLGRTKDAIPLLESALKHAQTLADADKDNAQLQRDLSVSHERLAEVFLRLNRLDDATDVIEAKRAIDDVLIEIDATHVGNKANLAMSHDLKGRLNLKLDNTTDALADFRSALSIAKELSDASPGDMGLKRDLSVSHERVANTLLKLDRPDEALTQCKIQTKLSRELADADPDDVDIQRSLSIACVVLGTTYMKLDSPDDAATQFRAAVSIDRSRVDADSQNLRTSRELFVSSSLLGEAYRKLGCKVDALKTFEEAMVLAELLSGTDPPEEHSLRDLTYCCARTGELLRQSDSFDAAISHFNRGIAAADALIANGLSEEYAEKKKEFFARRIQRCNEAIASTGRWQTILMADAEALPRILSDRASLLAKRGLIDDVEQAATKLRELEPKTSRNLYNAACAYGLCVTLVPIGDESSRKAERQRYVGLSIACLKEAIAVGFNEFEHMRQDPDLTALQNLPEFEALFFRESMK